MSLRQFAFFAASVVVSVGVQAAPIPASVDFSKHVRPWDGFGVNYVEVAQSRDYSKDPQEYGGFSLLDEQGRQKVLDMIFGPDGLKPGLLKMFLDSHHEPVNDNDDPNVIDMDRFDHHSTTRWMRYFAREGLKRTRARGGDLQVITTLYGPPGWTTRQKVVRGRDLDPAMKQEVAEYMISWVKYLREQEHLPVKWISLHNEGEDFVRWPPDGGDTPGQAGHDFNMFWPPEQVVDFIRFMPAMLSRHGLGDVGVTPGENTNWLRFAEWGYAQAIANDADALRKLGLITSHGFISWSPSRWFGDWRSAGIDMIRQQRPELHAWTTSQSWSRMDANFVNELRGNIYATKCNGIIPWATVQRPAKWAGGDPNPGCAFRIDEQGNLAIMPGYWFYKQITRAGQPGTMVAQVTSMDQEVSLAAFSANGTPNADAFVVINFAKSDKTMGIKVEGTSSRNFAAYRTSADEQYRNLGDVQTRDGVIEYKAPAGSVTTFFAH